MGTISLSLPLVGQPNSTEAPKVGNDLTTIQTWANGNVDGANVVASLTGRRLIAQASAFIGPGVAAPTGCYFVAADGTLVQSASSSTKPILWWYLDPANHAVTGKTNTLYVVRASFAVGVTPGVALTGELVSVTFSGGTGSITPTLGAIQNGTASIGSPAGASVNVVESAGGPQAFPAAGAYALAVTVSGTTAANSATSATVQLYVLNN